MSGTIATIEEEKPKLASRLSRAQIALKTCESWLVDSLDKYAHVADALKLAKSERADIESDKELLHAPIARAVREAGNRYTIAVNAWKDVERQCNSLMNGWDTEQLRKAKARQEQLRLAAEAERAEERAAQELKAAEAEEEGDHERAEELMDDAAQPAIPIPMIPTAEPAIEGLTTSHRWTYEVEDLEAVPMEWCEKKVMGAKVRAEAKRTMGKCQIPGLKIYKETTRSSKR